MRRRLASAALSAMPRAYNSSRPMHTCQCILPRRWAPVRPALGAARAAHAHSSHLARVCRCPKPTRACSRAPASMDPARPMHMAAQSPKYPFLHSSNKGLSPTSHLTRTASRSKANSAVQPAWAPKTKLANNNNKFLLQQQPSTERARAFRPTPKRPAHNRLPTSSRPPLDHPLDHLSTSLDLSRIF